MMKYHIFVYGTLKKGFPNHAKYMKSARARGRYHTIEKYPLVLCGERNVPCMIFSPGKGHHVEGELYEIGDAGIDRIDALERIQHPDGYRRYIIRVASCERLIPDFVEALAYLMPPEQMIDCRSDCMKTYRMDDANTYMPRI